MDKARSRWRLRISTVMLLVIIMALASALVVEWSDRRLVEQRLAVSLKRANDALQEAQANAALARASAEQALAPFEETRRDPGPSVAAAGHASGRADR